MKLSHLLAAASLSIASLAANATTITQSSFQTVGGQDFTFVFNGLSKNVTGGGTLTFNARGDYSPSYSGPASPAEILVGSAEGINFGIMGYDNANTKAIANNSDDTIWSKSFSLTNADLKTLLADSTLNVNAFLNSGVDLWYPGSAYVSVTLDYTPNAVPEPATLSLFGLALAGIAAARRRNKR